MGIEGPTILCVDDDESVLDLIELTLKAEGYRIVRAENGHDALRVVSSAKPDLVLVDYLMPGMTGIELCARLQEDPSTDHIPVIFLTSVSDEHERARAFAVGAVDYLLKPVDREKLKDTVAVHLGTAEAFESVSGNRATPWSERIQPATFGEFKQFLAERIGLGAESAATLSAMNSANMQAVATRLGLQPAALAEAIGAFLGAGLVTQVASREVRLGVLPTPFCKSNLVVPMRNHLVGNAFVVSNPFDWNLLEALDRAESSSDYRLLIAEPDVILSVFEAAFENARRRIEIDPNQHGSSGLDAIAAERKPVAFVADEILAQAVRLRAEDVLVEPGEPRTEIQLRVEGEGRTLVSVPAERGAMIVSRLKALGGMDISEKRRPQHGALEVAFGEEEYDLALTTGPTSGGESLSGRLIPVGRPPKTLVELGMSSEQGEIVMRGLSRPRGLVLVVGPGGSGKTTTAHAALSAVAGPSRSLMTIEDPIEYRIAFANQQQIDERSGITYDALMASAARRNPDQLFVGEIRDAEIARAVMGYARTRRLVVSTMSGSDLVAALVRLEEMGVSRAEVAEGGVCIVAQRLMRRLCPACRRIERPTDEERAHLAEFVEDVPESVAHSVGCPECGMSGYRGRTGVFEGLQMNEAIAGMLRTDAPMSDVGAVIRQRSGCSLCESAVDKVREFMLTPADVYEQILAELGESVRRVAPAGAAADAAEAPASATLLVVDDSDDTRELIAATLQQEGYEVVVARNGVEALHFLSARHFDLVLSDLNMPLMGGFDLFERVGRGESVPAAILYSASTKDSDEVRSLQMGAIDYIRLPASPAVVRLRVRRALEIARLRLGGAPEGV